MYKRHSIGTVAVQTVRLQQRAVVRMRRCGCAAYFCPQRIPSSTRKVCTHMILTAKAGRSLGHKPPAAAHACTHAQSTRLVQEVLAGFMRGHSWACWFQCFHDVGQSKKRTSSTSCRVSTVIIKVTIRCASRLEDFRPGSRCCSQLHHTSGQQVRQPELTAAKRRGHELWPSQRGSQG